jgi:class 3 adenylate cyclase
MNEIVSILKGFFKRFSDLPENVPAKEYRYQVVGSYAYFTALWFHFFFIFIFLFIAVRPLAIFNVASTLTWIIIVWSHLRGNRIISISLASFEVPLHAAMCVVFIGWETGFQYYILAMPTVIFFSLWIPNGIKVSLALAVCLIYACLHFFFGNMLPVYMLEPWLQNTLFYFNVVAIFFIFSLFSFIYQSAAINAEAALEKEKGKLAEMTELLKRMFGRYLSTEVMASLIENPSALELGGEKRRVTIMMTDLRGFTPLTERLEPEQVVQMLNAYFEVMVEVVLKYNGTINEIIGDALLIIFGAPQEMPDRAQRAIACAIEMQNSMAAVSEQNRAQGLPELEMGIGLNDTEVIVGNIGSSKRSKYAVVGSGVNMTSRIESYTVGGQILISESVRQEAGEVLRIDAQREVLPKGAEMPLRIYEVGGIAGRYNLALEGKDPPLASLARQILVRYMVLEGKDVGKTGLKGFVVRLSKNCAEITLGGPVEVMTNLKMNLGEGDVKLSAKDFYGKVIKRSDKNRQIHVVRFTSIPPEVDAYFQSHRKHAAKPAGGDPVD